MGRGTNARRMRLSRLLSVAGNTEPVGLNQRAGNTEHRLNPDAAEFHPGQQSGGQGSGGNQGQ